jgi:hypothetical protein
MKLRFDVNEVANREAFLLDVLPEALAPLTADRPSLWGQMSAQQMVEHLVWTLEVSNGTVVSPCPIPEDKRPRYRTFLLDNRPTPHGFESPVLREGLPPLRFASIDDAKKELVAQMRTFLAMAPESRQIERTHPLFGQLDFDGWSRNHFKHVAHHLLQFGLIEVEQVGEALPT